jgi:chromosome segregation ATPase
MSIDDLLGDLHEDRTGTVEEQLQSLERDIARRRLVSAETVVTLFGQIGELREQILKLVPEHEGAVDQHRAVREPLERERRQLERELQEELRNRWTDLRDLRREHRQLSRERTEEVQRYERHNGNYDG